MVPRPVISPMLALRAAWRTNCSVVRALMNACSRACCSIPDAPVAWRTPLANNSAPSEHPRLVPLGPVPALRDDVQTEGCPSSASPIAVIDGDRYIDARAARSPLSGHYGLARLPGPRVLVSSGGVLAILG